MDRETKASDRFACSERERCIFETGIKLATIYHQYVGTPFNSISVGSLEEAISRSIEVQPYVEYAKVTIDRSGPSSPQMWMSIAICRSRGT